MKINEFIFQTLHRNKQKSMKNLKVKLIDSSYMVNDAKEVLSCLIKDKITFINHKIFRDEERYGNDTEHLKMRIKALKTAREDMISFLDELNEEGHIIEIDCLVSVTAREIQLAS